MQKYVISVKTMGKKMMLKRFRNIPSSPKEFTKTGVTTLRQNKQKQEEKRKMFIHFITTVLIFLTNQGECSTNVALHRPAKDCKGKILTRVTDGRHDTSETISITCGITNPWITVDFDTRYVVHFVVIVEVPCNRKGIFVYSVILGNTLLCNKFVGTLKNCTTIRINCKDHSNGHENGTITYENSGSMAVAEIEFHIVGRHLFKDGVTLFQGCFKSFPSLKSKSLATYQDCRNFCAKYFYPFMAIETRALQCQCSNDYLHETITHDIKCTLSCHPDATECPHHYTVYRIRIQLPFRFGCIPFIEKEPKNAISSLDFPIERCLLMCDSNTYALIKNFTCICRDELKPDDMGKDRAKKCRQTCGGKVPCSIEDHALTFKTCFDGQNIKSTCTKLFTNCEGNWYSNGVCMTRCKMGFKGDFCLDKVTSPCDSNPCPARSSICEEISNEAFRCKCRHGFVNRNKSSCIKATCSVCNKLTSTCVAIPNVMCLCKQGFVRLTNFTCRVKSYCSSNPCDDETTTCEEKRQGYFCRCKPGFKKMNSNKKCFRGHSHCESYPCNPRTSLCRETNGWFYCICKSGHIVGDDGTCIEEKVYCKPRCDPMSSTCAMNLEGKYECRCRRDYQLVRSTCVKSEHCKPDPCSGRPNMKCVNIGMTYKCICVDGYFEGFMDDQCEDIDECDFGPCSPASSECINKEGHFICECKPGYVKVTQDTCRASSLNATVDTYLDMLQEYEPFLFILLIPILSFATMIIMRIFSHVTRRKNRRSTRKNFSKHAEAEEDEEDDDDDDDD